LAIGHWASTKKNMILNWFFIFNWTEAHFSSLLLFSLPKLFGLLSPVDSGSNLATYNRVFVFLAGVKRALWSLQAVRNRKSRVSQSVLRHLNLTFDQCCGSESESFTGSESEKKFGYGFGFGSRHCCRMKICVKNRRSNTRKRKILMFSYWKITGTI
jgi:hypothetical protein